MPWLNRFLQLKLPSFTLCNNTGFADIAEIPSGQILKFIASALRYLRDNRLPGVSQLVDPLFDTPLLRGAVFLPSDAAVQGLFTGVGKQGIGHA